VAREQVASDPGPAPARAAVPETSARVSRLPGDPAASDLKVVGMSKHFKDVVAVRDVSFEAQAGEFISFLGPSGCGKTTTLSMIAGFQEVTAGAIFIRGRRVEGLPPEKRNTGMVFQDYALFPHMSVAENVSFGLRMRHVPKADIRSRVAKALGLVRMSDFAARSPTDLSGGQKQRVALARALVIEPDVLLLDEPFGALDRQLRERMQFELKSLQQAVGITTVFVTHDQEEALLLSSRIAVMNQGAIEQIGSPGEIYETPATIFVAQFIGKSNFLPGDVVSATATGASIDTPAGRIVVQRRQARLAERQHVACMVRPEALHLLRPGTEAGGDDIVARGVVREIAYQGASTQIILDLPGAIEFVALKSTSEVASLGVAFEIGKPVDVSWPASAMLFFTDGKSCA
jgi:spermidine/putrescine ABC transporter ATP-binding subunit